MRIAFGVGSLLVVLLSIGIIMHLESGEISTDIAAKKNVEPFAQQITGHDENGVPADQSASLQASRDSSEKLKGLIVAQLVNGGAYEKYFGLQQFDLIVQAGPLDMRDDDEETDKVRVFSEYQNRGHLTVMRGTQKLTLPLAAGSTPTASTPMGDQSASPSPVAPPAQPDHSGNPIQNQLDAITNVPTH